MATNSRSNVSPIIDRDKDEVLYALRVYYAKEVAARGGEMNEQRADHDTLAAAEWLISGGLKKWLFLSGNVGTGKTTLMKAIQKTLLDYGVPCKMFRASDFPVLFLNNAEQTERQLLRGDWCEVLLLDDIGVEQYEYKEYGNVIRPFVKVVEERYNRLLPMIVSTNLTGEDIRATYGERTIDRIKEMAVGVKFNGKSYRK